MNNKTSKALAVLVALSAANLAYADSILEEVVVTAQKRDENLQDVPIAITAFTGEQLNAMGVETSIDVATFSPGVHISGNLAGQNTQFSIRGVTQNDFNDIIEAPNAVYLDEGYLAVAQAQTFAVFDIERVEILKGPQGTLFGRNATGGLVHYISNRPDFDAVNGYVDFELGRFDTAADANRTILEAAVGMPFSDNFAGRAAIRVSNQDGYLQNLYDPVAGSSFNPSPGTNAGADLGDDDTTSARLSFAFKPSDRVQWDWSFNYSSSDVATGPYQSKSTIGVVENGELINVIDTPAGETRLTIDTAGGDAGADVIDGDEFLPGGGFGLAGRPLAGGDFFGYLDPDGDDFTFSSDFAFEHQGSTDTWGINQRVVWDMENGMTFTSVTDYKDYEKLLFIDVDSAPVNQLANYAGVDATSFTQEFRLNGETDKMRWLAGLYYLTIDNQSDNGLKAPVNSIVNTAFGAPFDIGVVADLQTDSYSLFGQFDYDLSDELTLTGGLRVIREEKDFNVGIGFFSSPGNFEVNQGGLDGLLPDVPFPGAPFFFADSSSDTLRAGKLQLDWKPDDDLLLYAGINRGVKAGSYNAPLLGAFLGAGGNSSLPYDEEILTSYEAGFKSSLSDTTRLNGSLFYYDYSGYQAFLFVGVGGVVVNADAENYGIELELQTSPTDNLDFILSMSYFNATVEDILLRNGSPLPPHDVKPTYAPEKQLAALVRYSWDGFGGSMAWTSDLSTSDEFFYNLRNFDADKFDSYRLLNTQLSWENTDRTWSASFAIRNLTDERAGVQGFDLATLCGCNEVSYRAPRTYTIGVRRSF